MGYENFTDNDSIIIKFTVNSLPILTAYRKCHTSKVMLAYWNKRKAGIKLNKLSNKILITVLVSFLLVAVVNPYFPFQFNFFNILVGNYSYL